MNIIIFTIVLSVKNLLMLIILLQLKKLDQVIKFLNLELVIQSAILSITIFVANVTMKIGQKKHLLLILC